MTTKPDLYDAVAVSMRGGIVQWVMGGKTRDNAEAAVEMAVERQGVKENFFAVAVAGQYQEGDKWKGGAL